MSEIFNALQRAQRDGQVQRRRAPGRGATAPAPARPVEVAPIAAVPQATVTPPADVRRRSRWRRWFANGQDAAPAPSPLLISPAGAGEMVEAFRTLRSSLLDLGGGTIMITSALDEEGKTLCAANLAISLSLPSTREVVLVDLDLRRPNLVSRFGLADGPGVVDCLLGTAEWRDCLKETPYPHLKILPAGASSKSAPELLASEALRRLLADIHAFAATHFVLFDTPPVLLTADPLTLAGQMDRLLLVVQAASTPRSAVQKAVEALGSEKLLGVVLNQATVQLSDYYRYGSSYGYRGRSDGGTRSAT